MEALQITQEELYRFHETHFSDASIGAHFYATWLAVQQAAHHGSSTDDAFTCKAPWKEDDGETCGDGAAAAVADQQQEAREADMATPETDDDDDGGAGESPLSGQEVVSRSKQRRRRKKTAKSGGFPRSGNASGGGSSEKPDLRKRTWDLVDTMVPDRLDYDDTVPSLATVSATPQRRRVQYGDDDAW